MQSPRVLFGTIKSLDEIDSTNLKTLNCSQISHMKVFSSRQYFSLTLADTR